jgi:hypothetical protein
MNHTHESPNTELRLKLLPSFHQHVEIRLMPCDEGTAVLVWVQGEYVEPHPLPDRGPDFTEEALAPAASFEEAVAAFEVSLKAAAEDWPMLVLDGMSAEGTLFQNGRISELNEHTWRPGMGVVVKTVIRIAWDSCQDPRVKNALGACAGYNNESYPALPVPPVPHRTHVLLLGDPGEKQALRQAFAGSSEQPASS